MRAFLSAEHNENLNSFFFCSLRHRQFCFGATSQYDLNFEVLLFKLFRWLDTLSSQSVEVILLLVLLLLFFIFLRSFPHKKGPPYENTSQNGGVRAALLAARPPLKGPFTTFAVMDSDGPVSLYTLEGGGVGGPAPALSVDR